ncbi:MAG: MBL fold metallo-hydrolase [Proteobacteria bacterium]|nr:MBL fold metallo-hydrolase [Pseudomonadota bacterium]
MQTSRFIKLILVAALLVTSTLGWTTETPLTLKVFNSGKGGGGGFDFSVNSAIVMGEKDAVLIDAQFTMSAAHRLVADILETGKRLTTIYITHWHPDH